MQDSSPPLSPDLSSLGQELERSFLPAWAREEGSQIAHKTKQFSNEAGQKPFPAERERNDFRGDRRGERRPARGTPDRGRPHRKGGHPHPRSTRPRQEPEPAPLVGWEVKLQADPHGVEGLGAHIRRSARAYPLFELARLVLRQPARYLLEFRRSGGRSLWLAGPDGSLWLKEEDAVARILAAHLDKFYRRESVSVDPPKGVFNCVAQCGLSGTILGPPNHHEYTPKLIRFHREHFPQLPFEQYRSRIRMVRDEEIIEQWKQSRTSRDEFVPLQTEEGEEGVRLTTLAEVKAHFLRNYLSGAIMCIQERVKVPGEVGAIQSAPEVSCLVRRHWEELQKFPLSLAHSLGQSLARQGLHLFKARQKITFVSAARPRHLDYKADPVRASLRAILECIESFHGKPRSEQWEALLQLSGSPESPVPGSEAELAADLNWLIREGIVIDYAGAGLEITPRPSQSERPPKKKPKPSRSSEAANLERGDELTNRPEGDSLTPV